jgi:hypothetical protein
MGGSSAMNPTIKKAMLWVLPPVVVAITAFQPAALQLSFIAAMAWGAGQGYLLRQLWFRNFFKMELYPWQTTNGARPSARAISVADASNAQNVSRAANARKASSSSIHTGGLRTTGAPPLRYEAPRAIASREMAQFRAPLKVKEEEAKPAGYFSKLSQQATDLSTGIAKTDLWKTAKAKMVTPEKPGAAREKRAKEYEKRRKVEKRDEADMRRQGRS